MSDFESMKNMLKQSGKANDIMNAISPDDNKKIGELIDQKALSKAMTSGDTKAMEDIVRGFLNTGDGKAIAEKIVGIIGK